MSKTKKMTTCAMLIALAAVLAQLSKLIPSPWLQGGSVTLAASVPVVIASAVFGVRWGLLSSAVYAVIQLITGFYPPPTQTLLNFILVIVLDYLLAFGVYGIAGIFCRVKKPLTIPLAGAAVMCMRFLCHILSGLLIWGVYAEEGQSIFVYSFLYNGSYMVPEIIITVIVLFCCGILLRKSCISCRHLT